MSPRACRLISYAVVHSGASSVQVQPGILSMRAILYAGSVPAAYAARWILIQDLICLSVIFFFVVSVFVATLPPYFFLLRYSTKPDRYQWKLTVFLPALCEAVSSLGYSTRMYVSGRDLDLDSLHRLHYRDFTVPLAIGGHQIANPEEPFAIVKVSYGSHSNPP